MGSVTDVTQVGVWKRSVRVVERMVWHERRMWFQTWARCLCLDEELKLNPELFACKGFCSFMLSHHTWSRSIYHKPCTSTGVYRTGNTVLYCPRHLNWEELLTNEVTAAWSEGRDLRHVRWGLRTHVAGPYWRGSDWGGHHGASTKKRKLYPQFYWNTCFSKMKSYFLYVYLVIIRNKVKKLLS
jgi:hypothetical protein